MPDIWLVQLLCPARHCIVATGYELTPATTPAEIDTTFVEALLQDRMTQQQINPWCGLCGSHALVFEHRRTPYTDWPTALAAFKREEAKQRLTAQILGNRFN